MTKDTPLGDISRLEKDLWEAADQLRANSKLTSSEYCMPVLGVIFLRHAANRFEVATRQIEADQAAGRMPKRPLIQGDYVKRHALMLPEIARYDTILGLPKSHDLGKALIAAMKAIEESFEPLAGVLPKEYGGFGRDLLEDLLKIFNRDALRTAGGDLFGRIYEYFLMEFAIQGAQDNGEFFTPPSLVQLIANVIEPGIGKPQNPKAGTIVLDPAAGSGGMFVQSSHFLERMGFDAAHNLTFYGQEKTGTTIKLAKMNLAVHGLEGDIREANTFYEDVHTLCGKCDRVMANPPFNVDMVDAKRVSQDPRLPFGLPGVNKAGKVSNANYLWISYFWSYLNEQGRSGFVMSSQASSAGHTEKEVRRKIIETGDVDVMIAIRSNFFYTRTVPCELWHFDRGRSADRRGRVLMLDARNVYRKVTRKIYDFSPEQLANLTAIVWLYRGQTDRFTGLVQQYLDRTLAEAAALAEHTRPFREAYQAISEAAAPHLQTIAKDAPLRGMIQERDEAARACIRTLDEWTARISGAWTKPNPPTLAAQKKRQAELDALAIACRDLVKDIDLVYKLAVRVVDAAESDGARAHAAWDGRAMGRLVKDLDARRREAVEQLKLTSYFERQAHWLLSRFPDGVFTDVPGLCRVVGTKEIEAADWSLTPGRYVGVAPPEEDEDFDFEQAMRDIHTELADLNTEAAALAATIQRNFEELGI